MLQNAFQFCLFFQVGASHPYEAIILVFFETDSH